MSDETGPIDPLPPLVSLANARTAFAVPPDVAYFNTASLSPMLHRAVAAGHAGLQSRATPWNFHERDWFDAVEVLRGLFAEVAGVDAEGVALVPATSYGLGVVARNLPLAPGTDILVLAEEYPSGIYTWRARSVGTDIRLVTVAREPGQTSWTEAVLAALDERIGLVSVPNLHWTDGALVDLVAVARRAREVGAFLVVDASQSLGVLPLDMAEVQPDAIVSVGYKWLLGPFGRAYLWVAEAHRAGRPLEQNWITRAGADDLSALVDYTDEFQPGARRYDQGARTLIELTPIAIAALEQIRAWGVAQIGGALAVVTADLAGGLGRLGLEPSAPPDRRAPHILGIPVPDAARPRVLPALEQAGCYAALRGSSLRIAPHLHITPTHVERLVSAVGSVL
ncbi:MAG TPA: aminotransferase class V-fold PLP-dependent enzyme [Acidimicrobiales bacterium]|jgi:selenocysteine lyase/cysteine desulfurase